MGIEQEIGVQKDPENQRPVPSAWRGTLSDIVRAFKEGDYRLSSGIAGVRPLAERAANGIKKNIDGYGVHLVSLPSDAWSTSVCMWMETHWEVLVDLYTAEEGRSDLVLHVRVFECGLTYAFEVDSVHVP